MAFNFGPTSTAPATAAPVAAPSFGSFGSTSSSLATPSTSSFSFGGASTPGPAPFSFGGSTTPAASSSPSSAFSFGASTTATAAPMPSFGVPAAAPGAPSMFGSPAPAPFSFGAPATSAPLSGSTFAPAPPPPSGSFFGQPTAPPQAAPSSSAPAALIPASITGHMLYADLSPAWKQTIDQLHQEMMRHKRTMMAVQSMHPQLLLLEKNHNNNKSAASSRSRAGPLDPHTPVQEWPLPNQVQRLQQDLTRLQETLGQLQQSAERHKTQDWETLTRQAVQYGQWPVEWIARRKQIRLSSSSKNVSSGHGDAEEKKEATPGFSTDAASNTSSSTLAADREDMMKRLQELLDQQLTTVDTYQKMPSPYVWEMIHSMEMRLQELQRQLSLWQKQQEQAKQWQEDLFKSGATRAGGRPTPTTSTGSLNDTMIPHVIEKQHEELWIMASAVAQLRTRMEELRLRYRQWEASVDPTRDVLDQDQLKQAEREDRLHQQLQRWFMNAHTTGTIAGSVGAPATTSGMGATMTPTPAPAPPTGFSLFGSPPAPAPAFGSTPAPASTTTAGSFFGASTAPATGSLFGATTPNPASAPLFGVPNASTAPLAPAPAFFGSSFGTTAPAAGAPVTTPNLTPKKKSGGSGRSNSRLRR